MTDHPTRMVGMIRQMSDASRLCRGSCSAGAALAQTGSKRAQLLSVLSRDANFYPHKPSIADALSVPGHVAAVLVGFAWHG